MILRYLNIMMFSVALLGASCPNKLLKLDKTSKEYTIVYNDGAILKQGWNYLHRSQNGVDIKSSFSDKKEIESICVYDMETKKWAKFPKDKDTLALEKIEPNTSFYIYSNKNTKIKIKTSKMSSTCQRLSKDDSFEVLTDSGLDNEITYNKNKTVGLKSRYRGSHYRTKIYNDSRLSLIYPVLKTDNSKVMKYGPAAPRSYMEYPKEYEGKKFYMYSYKDEKCYMGIFPSRKIPPFPNLKELRD